MCFAPTSSCMCLQRSWQPMTWKAQLGLPNYMPFGLRLHFCDCKWLNVERVFIWLMTENIWMLINYFLRVLSLWWHHHELYGVSNHQHLDGLLNRLFRRRSKKTSKLRVTGLCEGNSLVTGEFPSQKASNAQKCFHLMTSSCLWP